MIWNCQSCTSFFFGRFSSFVGALRFLGIVDFAHKVENCSAYDSRKNDNICEFCKWGNIAGRKTEEFHFEFVFGTLRLFCFSFFFTNLHLFIKILHEFDQSFLILAEAIKIIDNCSVVEIIENIKHLLRAKFRIFHEELSQDKTTFWVSSMVIVGRQCSIAMAYILLTYFCCWSGLSSVTTDSMASFWVFEWYLERTRQAVLFIEISACWAWASS